MSADASGGPLQMKGDYAAAFASALGELPDQLAKLCRAYRGCGTALDTFAASLDQAQGAAGTPFTRDHRI